MGQPTGILLSPLAHSRYDFGVDLTQAELSTLIGVSEVTIQRALKMLRDTELIETGYRRVSVTDTARLARLADGHELPRNGTDTT